MANWELRRSGSNPTTRCYWTGYPYPQCTPQYTPQFTLSTHLSVLLSIALGTPSVHLQNTRQYTRQYTLSTPSLHTTVYPSVYTKCTPQYTLSTPGVSLNIPCLVLSTWLRTIYHRTQLTRWHICSSWYNGDVRRGSLVPDKLIRQQSAGRLSCSYREAAVFCPVTLPAAPSDSSPRLMLPLGLACCERSNVNDPTGSGAIWFRDLGVWPPRHP